MNKVLIILGMHRSGTSLVANWLHNCGLHLGDKLFEESLYNKKGYFEDSDFIEVHEEIFRLNNISSGGFMPPLDITLDAECKNKMKMLVDNKNYMREQWGWKEPRTCLFIDYYKKLIPSAKYLIVYRDYFFVVDSLIRRELKSKQLRYRKLPVLSRIKRHWKHKR